MLDNGYPHDGRADKNPYPHDRRADKDSYPHDSSYQHIILGYSYPSRWLICNWCLFNWFYIFLWYWLDFATNMC